MDAGTKLDDTPGAELLVPSERQQQKRLAVGESSQRRAEPAVSDDRCAAWQQLIVVCVRNCLDVACEADRLGAHRGSQREDRVDVLTGDRAADPLDEGRLASHHGGAEAEQNERSAPDVLPT